MIILLSLYLYVHCSRIVPTGFLQPNYDVFDKQEYTTMIYSKKKPPLSSTVVCEDSSYSNLETKPREHLRKGMAQHAIEVKCKK